MKMTGLAIWLVLGSAAVARAGMVEDNEVRYVSGTLAVAQETVGKFDTTGGDALVFSGGGAGGTTRIPYATISKVESYRALARHLGVLPAIGVGVVRKRERKHFLSISYEDAGGKVQVALFEISKDAPRSLLPILSAKSPQACGKDGCREVEAGDSGAGE